jgi:hypothetical protein
MNLADRVEQSEGPSRELDAEELINSAYERGYLDGREDASSIYHDDTMREGLAQWKADNPIASITALQEKLEAAKAAIKDAYREGFTDADEGQGTEDELYREFEACWEISRARTTLKNIDGEG